MSDFSSEFASLRDEFFGLCKMGVVEEIGRFLDEHSSQYPALLFVNEQNMASEFEDTPITTCVRSGFDRSLRFLLSKGADGDKKIKMGRTPLFIAASFGRDLCAKALIEHGVSIDDERDDGITALWQACANGQATIALLLLANGASPNKANFEGVTPLGIALQAGHSAEMFSLLLSNGANLNQTNRQGCTPLWTASAAGQTRVIKLLLTHNADPTMRDCQGLPPIGIAAKNNHIEVVDLLLSNGGYDAQGRAFSLLVAATAGHAKVVSKLLEAGVSPNEEANGDGSELPVIAAARRGHVEACKVLLLHASDASKEEAIDVATHKGHANVIMMIEQHMARLKFDKVFALKVACIRDDREQVASLVQELPIGDLDKCGVDDGDDVHESLSALMLCAFYGRSACFDLIVAAGGDVNVKASDKQRNRTATIFASKNGHADILSKCIDLKVRYRAGTYRYNETAIGVAAQFGRVACIRFLLTLPGIDLSRTDSSGDTVLSSYIKSVVLPDEKLLLELVERDLPCDTSDGSIRPKHGFSWAHVLDSSNLNEQLCLSLVEKILSKHAKILKQLAFSKDRYGRTVTNITHKSVKSWIDERLFFRGRYELKDGLPLHRSATAVVSAALDHSVENVYRKSFEDGAGGSLELDFQGFVDAIASLGLVSEMTKSEDKLREAFDFADKDHSEGIEIDEYMSFCTTAFGSTSAVVLKFMRGKEEFLREINARKNSCIDGAFVLDVVEQYDGDELGEDYFVDLSRLHLFTSSSTSSSQPQSQSQSQGGPYRYCIVLPAADRSLREIIDKERICGRDFDAVRNIASQLAHALGHLHSRSRIHGDLKPLNIMRVRADIKLIDLDASALIDVEHAASKFSSAYLPPELITPDGSIKQGQVPAHPSFDMWSFGCVLFQLCAGEPLWLASDEDNIDVRHCIRLHEWEASYKQHKLAKITDNVLARNLVSQLLSKEPSHRPASMTHILAHPFFTGHTAGRLPGEEAEFDVFLSYRVDSDSAHVKQLYELLVDKGLKVWWDVKCLKGGVSWEAGFCAGLVNSRCFVPLLSRAAIKSRFEALAQDSRCDNVLLEHRLAIELTDRGLLERVFPVMIGDMDASTGEYGNYFRQGCHPSASSSVVVRAVEEKLAEHLESQGLGFPLRQGMSVKAVLDAICVNQGGFVQDALLFEAQAVAIQKMVIEARTR